jgi:hypothetical protein
MRWIALLLLIAASGAACGGGSKPPLVPDDPNAPQPQIDVDGGSSEAGW